MTTILTAAVILLVLILLVALCVIHKHTPRKKITEELKREILSMGLIHFTNYDNAIQIQKEGLVPQESKAISKSEKNMVWMYLNNEKQFRDKWEIIQKKGDRKNYDKCVIIQGIQDKQIEQMRYRKSDMAIVHMGILKTEDMTVKPIVELLEKGEDYYDN